MNDFGIFISGLILITVALIGALVCLGMYFDYAECHAKALAIAMPAEWGPFQGCVVEYAPGKRALLDQLRIIDGQMKP